MTFTMPDVNVISFLPELILLIAGTALLFLRCKTERTTRISFIASLGICLQELFVPFMWGKNLTGFDGMIVRDDISLLFQTMIAITTLLAVIFSHYYLTHRRQYSGEYFGLILYAVVGMNIMIAARDLLVIFFGMEILSLSLYVLVGFFRDADVSVEATIKYFLLGAFSSAIFLLGIAFFYGVWGQTDFAVFASTPPARGFNPRFLMASIALICVGLGFKIASVPFHMWAPDTYEGAPISISSLLSVAPKIAAFAVFLRITLVIIDLTPHAMSYVIIVMSVASMIVGNLAALRQPGLVRMLAYSGIAQVGYMLIGLLSIERGGGSALIFYLLMYVFMNMGAFGIAIYFSMSENKRLLIDDLSGLATHRPLLALAMAFFMISLAGIPPTAGFFSKFFIFKTGIEAGYLWIVIIAIIMTVVSLFYYFKVVMVMFMGETSDKREAVTPAGMNTFALLLGILACATVIFGIAPGYVIEVVSRTLQ